MVEIGGGGGSATLNPTVALNSYYYITFRLVDDIFPCILFITNKKNINKTIYQSHIWP